MGKNGGARPGAGRKPGSKNPATLEREAVQRAINQQIFEQAATLVRSAFLTAKGMNFVYRIDEIKTKKGVVISVKHTLVRDPEEIALALDKIAEGGHDPEGKFYFVTTDKPDHSAIKMLLDRAFGKAKESLELSNPDGNLKTIIINKSGKK